MDPRIVFMGSPEFSLPTLQALHAAYNVVGVITQPDRPAGRGRSLTPPPVKVLAQEASIPVIQPRRLSEPEAMQQLQEWQPDMIVVAAFGQILRPNVLNLPPRGCINVHASLLPRWRGAAPINAALLAGDEQTGISIMCMDSGIDTGPVLAQAGIPILSTDNAGSLSAKLAQLGAELLIQTLPEYLTGKIVPLPQDETLATYAAMLEKEDGRLDFHQPAGALERKVRAFNPWPGAYTEWQGQTLKVHRAHAAHASQLEGAPGAATIHENMPAFFTAHDLLVLDEVQPAGKKAMPGEVFLRGARDWGA
jgi:methionyl-tRNA formyltransferase